MTQTFTLNLELQQVIDNIQIIYTPPSPPQQHTSTLKSFFLVDFECITSFLFTIKMAWLFSPSTNCSLDCCLSGCLGFGKFQPGCLFFGVVYKKTVYIIAQHYVYCLQKIAT